MKVAIEGTPKELAALVIEIQERRVGGRNKTENVKSMPVDIEALRADLRELAMNAPTASLRGDEPLLIRRSSLGKAHQMSSRDEFLVRPSQHDL